MIAIVCLFLFLLFFIMNISGNSTCILSGGINCHAWQEAAVQEAAALENIQQ